MATYNELVGERLRSIRRQRGLSLQDVQRITDGEFKAAVLGAYERGERSLSVPRLRRLASVYGVPIVQMLPPEPGGAPVAGEEPSIVIDLNRIERLSGQEAVIFERFLHGIQLQRQDFNGRVLTVRRDDLKILAMLLEATPSALRERLRSVAAGEETS